MPDTGRLVIACPDRPGIVAAVADFLYREGANVIHSDQHSTHDEPAMFFLRVQFEGVEIDNGLSQRFQPLVDRFEMHHQLVSDEYVPRLAVFVSKEDHCLQELLWNIRAGDFRAKIAMIISNHPDLKELADSFKVPFHHVPVPKGDKSDSERKQLELVEGNADLIVLARYMQIVSPTFLERWPNRVINIHHSFLPAFVGARPYHQAYERGVKLIGATAHYVTSELDAGPIIEQAVARVDHRCDVPELQRIGRQIERAVLARAVKWHVEGRVVVHGNRTVVFA